MDVLELVSLAAYGGFSSDDDWCLWQDIDINHYIDLEEENERLRYEAEVQALERYECAMADMAIRHLEDWAYCHQMQSIVSLCRWSPSRYSLFGWRDCLLRTMIGEYFEHAYRYITLASFFRGSMV